MAAALPLVLAVHAPTAAQAARQLAGEAHRCSGKLTLTGDGVGAVRVGATVAAVRKACHVPAIKLKKGESPPPAELLTVKIGMTEVKAEIMAGRVWRVIVDDGSLQTGDRLGVGSPLSAVLAVLASCACAAREVPRQARAMASAQGRRENGSVGSVAAMHGSP